MGTATFASQMLMDPIKADEKAFDVNWIRYYNNSTARPHTRNFIFADPAGSKKEGSAYTVMWVVGVDQRNYYYILDCVRDRLDLQQKQRKLFDLVAKWKVIKVYYEKYSMQGDIEYIEEKKREEGFHFPIEEVGGTRLSKDERILKLQPLFQEGRMIFPEKLPYTDCNGKLRNLVDDFIMEEYNEFPVSQYKDMLDALSRLRDEKVKVAGPAYVEPATHETDNPILRWHRQSKDASNGNSWLNA
jgi:phage terminase large subunit-like protein